MAGSDLDKLNARISELEQEVSLKELRKSRVRVMVTYGAALFLFLGGAIFIAFLVWTQRRDEAITLFNTILPVAASILAFWFAGRSNQPK